MRERSWWISARGCSCRFERLKGELWLLNQRVSVCSWSSLGEHLLMSIEREGCKVTPIFWIVNAFYCEQLPIGKTSS